MLKHSAILKALCKWMEEWCYWGGGAQKGALFLTISQCFWVTPPHPRPGSVGNPALRTEKNQWPQSWLLSWTWLFLHSLGAASAHLVCRKWPRMSKWRLMCSCPLGAIYMEERERVKKVLLSAFTCKGLWIVQFQELENIRDRRSGYIPEDLSAVPTKGLAEGR